MNSSEFVFVYSTFPDMVSAETVASMLVEGKLAACVNIHAAMKSLYAWEGKVESQTEFSVFIKTRRAFAEGVISAARERHPYSVPCFLVLPIETGNADYLAWAREQTERGT